MLHNCASYKTKRSQALIGGFCVSVAETDWENPLARFGHTDTVSP
jgi:hypothetical protein